jgi:hypothetical protein
MAGLEPAISISTCRSAIQEAGAAMRFYVDKVANALAWAAIIVLLAGAFVIARFAGFLGLVVLGLIAAVICLRVEADEHNPFVWARADFDAALKSEQVYGQNSNSAEQFAVTAAERREFISPFRFVRWCGIAVAAIGAVGFVWRQW